MVSKLNMIPTGMTKSFFAFAVMMFVSCSVNAGEWSFDHNLGGTVGFELTDNVDSNSNSNRQFLTFSPNFSLHGEGSRLKVDVDGSVKFNGFGGGRSSNPRLQADATIELLEDLFFVDGRSRITANAIDPFINSGSNLSSTNDNRTNTSSYEISPYLVWRFGQVANAELRYAYNLQDDTENLVGESTSNEYEVRLNSGRYFGPFSWGLRITEEEIDYEESADSKFKTVNLNLGYQIDRQWRLTANIGEDENDYPAANSNTGGSVWDVGTVWTPNQRVSVSVSAGDAYFGSTQSLDASYRHKRSVLTASYTKGVTNARTLLREQQIFFVVDQFGQPIINPFTGEPFLVALDVAQLNSGNFVDERFELGYAWQGKRMTAGVKVDHSKQQALDSIASGGELKNITFSLDRNLSKHISANSSLSLSNTQSTNGTDADIWRLTLGATRQLGKETRVNVRYSHTNRDSSRAGDSSKENRVSVNFSFDL